MASQEGMGSYRHRLHRLLSLPNMDNQRGLEGSPVLWYDRILISYHIITYHIISYQVISYHIMSYHCHIIVISCCYHIVIIPHTSSSDCTDPQSLSYLSWQYDGYLLLWGASRRSEWFAATTKWHGIPARTAQTGCVGVTKVVASLWLLHWILCMHAVCVSTCMCMPMYILCMCMRHDESVKTMCW